MFALVYNNIVVDVSTIEFPVVSTMTWLDISTVSPTPAYGWSATETSGVWSYTAPASPVPAPLVVEVTSTATSALNGTYVIGATSLANIVALSTGIAAGKGLPGGGTTFNYGDANGAQHAFTSANFLNFAQAIEDFVYLTNQAIIADTTLPSNSLTIA